MGIVCTNSILRHVHSKYKGRNNFEMRQVTKKDIFPFQNLTFPDKIFHTIIKIFLNDGLIVPFMFRDYMIL